MGGGVYNTCNTCDTCVGREVTDRSIEPLKEALHENATLATLDLRLNEVCWFRFVPHRFFVRSFVRSFIRFFVRSLDLRLNEMGWFWSFLRTFVRSFVRSFLFPRAAKPARRWRNGRTHLLSPHRHASVSARTSRFRPPRRHISRRRDDAEPRGRCVAAVRTPNGERSAHPPVRRATDSTRRSI